jgi:hypothetical protein
LSDQIQIRPGDFPQWKPLWDGYNAFYGREGETALPDAVTQMTWSRFFDAYEPMHVLVAEQAGSSRVYWLTHETNATARKLYDKVAELSGFLVYRKPL